MVKVQQTKLGQFMVTLPRNLVKALGIKKGDELVIGLDKDNDIFLHRTNSVKTIV